MNLNFQNNAKKLLNAAGFTLLEVLISMAILVFISFAIYQATVETFKLRDSLSTEGNFHNSIRLATSIIQRDISLMYTPLTTFPSPTPSQTPGAQLPPPLILPDDLGQSFVFWSAAVNINGLRPSRMIGTDTKLSFISLSYHRIYKDSPASEFAKITYELKREERKDAIPDTQVLFKTESPNAFTKEESRDQFVRSYDMLHGIKNFSLKYYTRDGNTWKTSKSWDTDKEEYKNRFPDMIEMTLEVWGPNRQTFEGSFKFRPEIPNNGLNPRF